jgi:hypothetical protein
MNAVELQQAQALAADIKTRLTELQSIAEKIRINSEAIAVLKSELARRDFSAAANQREKRL